jgi:hypothetical protein
MISLSRCASQSTGLPALLRLLPTLVVLPSLLPARALGPRTLRPALLLATPLLIALLLAALLIAVFLHRDISFEGTVIDAAGREGKGCATGTRELTI